MTLIIRSGDIVKKKKIKWLTSPVIWNNREWIPLNHSTHEGPGNKKATCILLKLKRVGMQSEYDNVNVRTSSFDFKLRKNTVHSNYNSRHFDFSLLNIHTNVTYGSTCNTYISKWGQTTSKNIALSFMGISIYTKHYAALNVNIRSSWTRNANLFDRNWCTCVADAQVKFVEVKDIVVLNSLMIYGTWEKGRTNIDEIKKKERI